MLRKNGRASPRESDNVQLCYPIPPVSRLSTFLKSARREIKSSKSEKSVVVACVTSSRISDTAGSHEPSEN